MRGRNSPLRGPKCRFDSCPQYQMNIKELNASLIENTKLTDEEEAAALFEGKKKKYFKEKHKHYWNDDKRTDQKSTSERL